MKSVILIAYVASLIIVVSAIEKGPKHGKKRENKEPHNNRDHHEEEPELKKEDPYPLKTPCGRNETYSTCVNKGCLGATYCSEKGAPVKCERPKNCYQGCICKKGYLRDDNSGECILEKDCSEACGGDLNARPGCGNHCGRRCSDYQYLQQGGVRACPLYCLVGGCDCKPGYLFDDVIGKCVSPVDCAKCLGRFEVYDPCPSNVPDTCASISQNSSRHIRPDVCEPACRCQTGFYRDAYGVCVPKAECYVSCNGDPNAIHGCGNPCGDQCQYIDRPETIFCPAICKDNSCDCKDGYTFDEVTGKCVLPKDCSRFKCSRPHEVYHSCPDCSPQTCETIDVPYACPLSIDYCQGQCRCEPGYYRNKIGECISKENCVKCTGPHEYYSCGGACDNVCATLSEQNQTSCKIQNIKCNEQCYCDHNFARDVNGICIPIEQCPSDKCPANEYYETCPDRCKPETCNSIGKDIECPIGPAVCQPACRCVEGHYRNDKGVCIPELDCTTKPCINNTNTCNGDHNAKPGCGINCGRLCSNYDSIEPVYCIELCYNNACDCKESYVLDETVNKCVLPEQCNRHKCKNPNEVYDVCPAICPARECGVDPSLILCAPQPKPGDPECEPGCRCADGFLKNDQGICVRASDCPDPKCDGKHEIRNGCVNGGCFGARKCSEVGIRPFLCIDLLPGYCKKGCICQEGYLYNDSGICIPEDKCPPPKCGENEEFSYCTNGGCFGARWCSEIGIPNTCKDVAKGSCEKGCICRKGFLRNEKGRCVPEQDCPFVQGDDTNDADEGDK